MITSMQRMAPRAGGSADTVRAQVSSLNFVMYIPAMVVVAVSREPVSVQIPCYAGN